MAKVKNKRNAGAADRVNQKRKAEASKKKLNPFEVHINREKNHVLGKKSKHDRGLPGVSRAKAIQKRKETLGTEMKLMHKTNTFIDKRIGEKDNALSAEDRMVARFAAERAKQHGRKNIYNLADDEVLTHRGQTLEQIEKFDDPRSDEEDEAGSKGLDDNFVSEGHFGGGVLSKSDRDGAKSHKDLIEQLIAESKKRKAEKQKEKEQTLDLTEKLDSEWRDLQPVVFKRARIEEESAIDKVLSKAEKNSQDYDKMMRELRFEKRGTPSDAVKTDEKLEREENERIAQLEKERERRMFGDQDSGRPKSKHRSADDLDDNFELDDEKEFMLAYDKDGKPLVPDHILKDYSVPKSNMEFDDNVTDSSDEEEEKKVSEDDEEESDENDDQDTKNVKTESKVETNQKKEGNKEKSILFRDSDSSEEDDSDGNEEMTPSKQMTQEKKDGKIKDESSDDSESSENEGSNTNKEPLNISNKVSETRKKINLEDDDSTEYSENEGLTGKKETNGNNQSDDETDDDDSDDKESDKDDSVKKANNTEIKKSKGNITSDLEGGDDSSETDNEESDKEDTAKKEKNTEIKKSKGKKTSDSEGKDDSSETDDEDSDDEKSAKKAKNTENKKLKGKNDSESEDDSSDTQSDKGNVQEILKTGKRPKLIGDSDTDEQNEDEDDHEISKRFLEKTAEYQNFKKLLSEKTPLQQSTVLQKLIRSYDPSLGENNKEKLSELFANMLRYVDDLFSKIKDESAIMNSFRILEKIAPYFYDINQTNKVSSRKFFAELLIEKHEEYKKKPKKVPDMNTLIFFKLISLLYPTSDFRHPITTPSLTFMSEILTTCRFRDAYAISRGMFVTTMILEYTALSKRYVPAAVNFIRGILYLSAKTTVLNPIQVVPPFRLHRDDKILILEEDCSKLDIGWKMELKDLVTGSIDNKFKIRTLVNATLILKEFFEHCSEMEAQECIFEPHIQLLSRLELELYPKKVASAIEGVIKYMKDTLEAKTYRPLSSDKPKTKTLRLYEPDVQEVFTGGKSSKLPRDQAEKLRLQHRYKREMKGALREIRRDKAYVASVKIRQKIHSDNIRKDKVKQIYKDASIQQGELNKLKRGK